MEYRIMKTPTGKYVAQVKRNFFTGWDEIFYAGVAGLVEYSRFRTNYGTHNNRYCNTVEECKNIIKEHKRILAEESGEHLIKVKDV